MKIEKSHIEYIRSAFEKMQSKEDLLQLMNYAKPLIYGEKSVPFDLKQLTYYAYSHAGVARYKEFKIKKKSGGERSIHAPVAGLKAIQKTLALILESIFVPHSAAKGFIREKSIVDNAKVHMGNYYVYNIDLKDFFQSIDQARVWSCLQLAPFNLKKAQKSENNILIPDNLKMSLLSSVSRSDNSLYIGHNLQGERFVSSEFELQVGAYVIGEKVLNSNYYSVRIMSFDPQDVVNEYATIVKNNRGRQEIADIIANLCCTKMTVERQNDKGDWQEVSKNVLPQGAPTSPILTNVVCQRLDFLLTAVAKRFGLKYSRYADDITFSALHNVFQKDSDFLKEMERIIVDQGFTIKPSKTRLQVDGMQKVVTGLVVNDKVNVRKRYVKQLRMWLHYWETYGYYKAERIFKRDYFKDKGHVKLGEPNLSNVLDGKLNYLRMVKGADDSTYVKLKERFDKLNENTQVNKVLQIWEEQGIDNAMAIYEPTPLSRNREIQQTNKIDLSQFEEFFKL